MKFSSPSYVQVLNLLVVIVMKKKSSAAVGALVSVLPLPIGKIVPRRVDKYQVLLLWK
jgi:hypothetical protein